MSTNGPSLYDSMIVNLKILANVKMGQKLTCTDGRMLSFDENNSDGYVQPWMRWWRGNSRRKTLDVVWRSVRIAIAGIRSERAPQQNVHDIRESLTASLDGLRNLRSTYTDDDAVKIEIGQIIILVQRTMESKRDVSESQSKPRDMPLRSSNSVPHSQSQ